MSEYLTSVTCSLCGAIIVGLNEAKVLQYGDRVEHIHADAESCSQRKFDASVRASGGPTLAS